MSQDKVVPIKPVVKTIVAKVYDAKIKPNGTVVLCFVSSIRHYITYVNRGLCWESVIPSSFEISEDILNDVAKRLKTNGSEHLEEATYSLA